MLTSVADLPGQGVDLGAVSAHARTLDSVGSGLESATTAAAVAWTRVPASYESTGTESLYAVMEPVTAQGRAVHTALSAARRALEAYIEAAGPVLARVAALRGEVEHFHSETVGSYPKPAPLVADYDGYTTAGGSAAATRPHYDSWHDDPAAVAANDELDRRAARLGAELLELQQDCAAAIRRAAGLSSTDGRTAWRTHPSSAPSGRMQFVAPGGDAEGCAGSTGRTLGGLFHDSFADATHGVSDWFDDAAGTVGLVGAEVPRAWWQAESWVTGTLAPAAGLVGTMSWQWGSDRLAEAVAFQQSMNRAMLEHPDETLEMVEGALLTVLGGGIEGTGVALDATVLGAPAGLVLNGVGAAVIASGGVLAIDGGAKLMNHAANEDRVEPQYREASNSGGSKAGPTSRGYLEDKNVPLSEILKKVDPDATVAHVEEVVASGDKSRLHKLVDLMEKHLRKMDPDPRNPAMIAHLRETIDAGRPLHPTEVNALKHELVEKELMEAGLDGDRAHEVALQTHRLYENYHPDLMKDPELKPWFSRNMRRHWGIRDDPN